MSGCNRSNPELAYGTDPPAGFPAGPLRFIVDVLDAHA
jgi:hypothetical protein